MAFPWRALGFSVVVSALAIVAAPPPDPVSGSETPPGRAVSSGAESSSLGIEAVFVRDSYRPGMRGRLRIRNHLRRVTIQIFHAGPGPRTRRNDELKGRPVTRPVRNSWPRRSSRIVAVGIGNWESGVYFARLTADDGRVGFAPFIVGPERLGRNRVAVVQPTYTWQAYNFRDDDGDGVGDTWYADRSRPTVRLNRPYLNRGVPLRFRSYDLPFLRWLSTTERRADFLSQTDLEGVASARALRRRYDLVIFPGHHEYVTAREYNLITAYRNLGGNLMFLSANNFFWKVERRGEVLHKIAMWRDIGRPEAALVGVQYVAYGSHLRGPYAVRDAEAARWLFRETGLRNGSRFGTFGIEVDRLHRASPHGTRVVAELRNGQGRANQAQMTYYELRGARVFAAGAFTLAGSANRSYGARLLENLWAHLTRG
jgi:hypothetical protein